MSIVVVIIGLLIGAILAGKSLIRSMKITGIAVDEQRYVQAALQFQQHYGALPGDMANATNYWGAMSTCPPAPGQSSQGGTLTCNGNGDGQVNPGNTFPWEYFLFWQHLVNAQMIQGNYTGIAGAAGTGDHVPGINVPTSRVDGTGFGIFYLGIRSNYSTVFDGSYGHVLYFGDYFSNATPVAAALTALEAQSFDAKYDDGLPAYGNIRAFKGGSNSWSPNCATTAVASTAKYNVATTGPQCSLIFITGF